jgi:hypothetical protein
VLQAQQKAIEAENRQKEAVAESKQKLDCAQANFLKLTEMAKLEADMNVKQKEVLYPVRATVTDTAATGGLAT